jgi:hypothetical protein
MFIGHFALGFVSKAVAPKANLGTAFAAAQLLDLIWPPLVLLGIERVSIVPGATAFSPFDFTYYPWSHSMVMALVWSVVFGGVYYGVRRDRYTAIWMGGLVFSHWILDWVSHRPDMPIFPGGGPKVGLGLWHSVPATLVVELSLFAVGVAVYIAMTRARSWLGHAALAALVLAFLAMYFGSRVGLPPSPAAMAGGGLIVISLFVAWGWWADRLRATWAPSST